MTKRKSRAGKSKPTLSKVRSALTRGNADFTTYIDLRSREMRRWRDLLDLYRLDLGGVAGLSQGQLGLARIASTVQLVLEMTETKWASQQNMTPTMDQLRDYCAAANSYRRIIESLGLNAGPKALDRVDGGPGFKRFIEANVQ